jgi:hypothetical protein
MRETVKLTLANERFLSGINKSDSSIQIPIAPNCGGFSAILPQVIQQSPVMLQPLCVWGDYELLRPDNNQVTWYASNVYDPITVGARESSFPPPKPSIRMLFEPSWDSRDQT